MTKNIKAQFYGTPAYTGWAERITIEKALELLDTRPNRDNPERIRMALERGDDVCIWKWATDNNGTPYQKQLYVNLMPE